VARDRKRAKQRQRRQQRVDARAAAGGGRRAADAPAAPDPLEHASADAELAEVAEAVGLPADEPGEVFEDELEPVDDGSGDGGGREGAVKGSDGGAAPGAEPIRGGNRFVNFLRACVIELGRVQWPDRRQVSQATGVVLGFVVIAGAYLGLLDAIWSRVVNAIL
jgi:preprotein translocase SecE subunit